MIVVDTGAMLALLDAGEAHHRVVRECYEENPDRWILPWAILPEVDYLVAAHLGAKAQELRLGLVDAVVVATAERLKADAIATLDLRHFAAVSIKGIRAFFRATADATMLKTLVKRSRTFELGCRPR